MNNMNRLFFENLKPGTLLFRRFELLRCLSSGSVGAVYLCRLKSDFDRLVALKVLSTPAAMNQELSEAFRRELILSRSVSHPNVVRSEDFFRDEDFTAFSMEYVEGGSLADKIERDSMLEEKHVDIRSAFNIFTQIVAGLSAIHQANIIHRDIKPDNILVRGDGAVKIADFSIALSSSGGDAHAPDQIIGTLNYLSPEYLERGEIDPRMDIYSLGVIGYELFAGQLPFEGKNLLDTLMMRVKFDPIALRARRPELPQALCQIIHRAMHRDVNKRYQAVEDLAVDLRAIRGEILQSSRTVSLPSKIGSPANQNDIAIGEELTAFLGKAANPLVSMN